MLNTIGKKQETWKLRLDEVAMSLDDLTEQVLLANKLTAAAILHQQKALETEKYHEFLMEVYKW